MTVRGMLLASRTQLLLSPSDLDVSGFEVNATAFAGVEFNSDKIERRTVSGGGSAYTQSLGAWLDSGFSSQVWIQWTRTGGTLGDWNSEDSGDTRLQLSSSRAWRITRVGLGVDNIIGNFKFYDAASGGNLLHTTANRTFEAENDSGG